MIKKLSSSEVKNINGSGTYRCEVITPNKPSAFQELSSGKASSLRQATNLCDRDINGLTSHTGWSAKRITYTNSKGKQKIYTEWRG